MDFPICPKCGLTQSAHNESGACLSRLRSAPAQPPKKKQDNRYPLGHYNNPMPDDDLVVVPCPIHDGNPCNCPREAPTQPSQPNVDEQADNEYIAACREIMHLQVENAKLQAQLSQLREALFDVYYSAEKLIKQLQDHKDFHHPQETHLQAAVERAKQAYSTASSTDWLSTKLREAKAEALKEAADEWYAGEQWNGSQLAILKLKARAEELSNSNQQGESDDK